MPTVAILIPTFNNPEYLIPCVQSILEYTMTEDLFHIYIVNNGLKEHMEPFLNHQRITVLQQNTNVGWEGGLKAGIAASTEPYVMFLNDDTNIMPHQRLWLNQMLNHFVYPDCAAVGPTSNVVMGPQNVFSVDRSNVKRAKFLIGFCLLVKREFLEAAGGVDDTLPGGDDLDLSIRLRNLDKYLLIDREVFVWHHGFKTGQRVHGNNWNSVEMIERTNHALIRKHGLKAFLDLWGAVEADGVKWSTEDTEGSMVAGFVSGDNVLEIGCGDRKTVDRAIGIDIVPRGHQIPGLIPGKISVADRVGDVKEDLPVEAGSYDTVIARHILEHINDPIKTVRIWGKALKHGGRLVIAVPNQSLRNTIPMNYQHVNSYTPESLQSLMEALGWKTVAIEDPKNMVSFVGCFEKNGVH